MTVFGWDASDYDWGRGPMNLAAAHSDGIFFFTHKATEGNSVRHVHYGAALTRARDAGIPVLGAYHVVRTGPSIASQISAFLTYLDVATPWWRDHPNFFLQVDLERWSYDNVSPSLGTTFATQLKAAANHAVVIYASKGQYGNTLPNVDIPLWNANYPSSTAAWYHALYPGDGASSWSAYSGRTPIILQYSDTAVIAGQGGCDANAFRGTLDQLIEATRSGADVSAHTDAVIAAWSIGVTTAGDGTPVAPVTWRIRDEAWQAQVTAALAAAETRENATLAAVQALATAKGTDPAPILEAVNAVGDQAQQQFSALHQQLAAEQTARQAAEDQVAKLTAQLAALSETTPSTGGTSTQPVVPTQTTPPTS